jgi:hypothetical protein
MIKSSQPPSRAMNGFVSAIHWILYIVNQITADDKHARRHHKYPANSPEWRQFSLQHKLNIQADVLQTKNPNNAQQFNRGGGRN